MLPFEGRGEPGVGGRCHGGNGKARAFPSAGRRLARRVVPASIFWAILACPLVMPARVCAQAGTAVTPDRFTYIVNKDLAGERWTITVNLASVDPPRLISVTGNVYRPEGGPPSFIWCQIRSDSSGSLSDPDSAFALRCYGSDACSSSATACARTEWRLIAERVDIAAGFFLPGGAGFRAGEASPRESRRDGAAAALHLTPGPAAAPAQNPSRGATLPPDGSQFLVNKDVGSLRWSISLNLVPSLPGTGPLDSQTIIDQVNRGRLDNRLLSVTGNVFPPDGGEPQFVFCQELSDSRGDLADPASEFVFSCVGTGACERTPEECSREEWRDIPGANRLVLPAGFFLPEGGLPPPPLSDPVLIVIGRTSDPPSLLVSAFDTTTSQGTAAGGCAAGQPCSVPVGSCPAVTGRLVDDGSGCACLIEDVPNECILCDGGSSSCGGECQYSVRGRTARGRCLPFSSSSTDCACFATDPSNPATIGICGGSLNATCPEGRCCADDPRDGCDPARGDGECAGICVDSGGCDATASQCGICVDQRGATGEICGGTELEPGQDCCADTGFCTNCFCEAGATCVSDASADRCCPTSDSLYCPTSNLCIPDGADCCPNGNYCGAGYECTPSVCCPTARPWQCVTTPTRCGPEGLVCCDSGGFCPSGQTCGSDGRSCIPAGLVDCGNGNSCGPGQLCVSSDDGLFCDTPTRQCPNGNRCPAGSVCSSAGESCCPEDTPIRCGAGCFATGVSCCDTGAVCAPGYTCTSDPSTCCPVERPFLCPGSRTCTADARQCCGDGRACNDGFVCTIDPDRCCPAEAPLLCPNRVTCQSDLSLCGRAPGALAAPFSAAEPAGSRPASPSLGTGDPGVPPLGP